MAGKLKVHIEKLNSSNYGIWRYRVELLLISEDLWYVIQEDPPAITSDDYAKWVRSDGKARAAIGLHVDNEQFMHIRKVSSAKEAWNILKNYHEKTTLTGKVFLLKRLCRLRLEEDGDMREHIAKVTDLIDKLAAAGEEIVEHLVVAMFLCSLPDSYSTLITALESRPERDLTLDLVKRKLLQEADRRKEGEKVLSPNMATALKVQDSSGVKKKTTKRECYFCKKPGHYKRDCFKFNAQQKQSENSDTKMSRQKANKVENHSDTTESQCTNHACFKTHQGQSLEKWYVDSGATCHMTNTKKYFETYDENINEDIFIADGGSMKAVGIGNVHIECTTDRGNILPVLIKNVRYVPELDGSLLSVRTLTKLGLKVVFDKDVCYISKNDHVMATANVNGHLYELNCTHRALKTETGFVSTENCIHAWHGRLGHRNADAIRMLENKQLATGIRIDKCNQDICCESCIKGKMSRLPFPKKSSTRQTAILDLIHSDLCGPMQTETPGGKRYILTFIDDYSRYTTVYLLSKKSETFDKVREFVEACETKFQKTPLMFRTDRGGEYMGAKFEEYFKKKGIEHQMTAPYSPQQNGVAERKNRTLTEMSRCMLINADMANKYWGEAVCSANYLQNRLPSRAIDRTPHELWIGVKPDLSHLRIFGCKAYMHIPDQKRRKLDEKAKELTMVGYETGSKAYRLLDKQTSCIYISRDVKFVEQCHIQNHGNNFQFIPDAVVEYAEGSRSNPPSDGDELIVQDYPDRIAHCNNIPERENIVAVNDEPVPVPVRISSRSNKGVPPVRLIETAYLGSTSNDDPKTWNEAMTGQMREHWKVAMDDEMGAMRDNNVWKLVKLPPGKNVVGSKWVYKTKTDSSGNINRYKARLVAQGFTQKYGSDYDEVFAPVVRNTTLRTLLTVAGKTGMKVKHYDVKTAYLNGDLTEEVYMRQPEGYKVVGKEDLVCRLNKCIYGLKQSARAWCQKLNDVLIAEGFKRGEADHCLYSKLANGEWIYVLTYVVDDLIMTSCSGQAIEKTAEALKRKFELSDLGDLTFYLGIQFERGENGIFKIHQKTYIEKLIKLYGLENAKPSKVPMDTGYEKIPEVEDKLNDNELYRQAIGSLLYVTVNTRPDIAVSISILSRKVSSPSQADWIEVKRVLRYLKGTVNQKLCLGDVAEQTNLNLIGYADADWAGSAVDRKSNSGYVFKLYGGCVSWASRKQKSVSLSSTEAEYIALSEASQEAIWLKRLLADLHQDDIRSIKIWEDNQSCLKMLESERINQRSKHIDTKYHFSKDMKLSGQIQYVYCPTSEMVADVLTKPLEAVKIRKFCELLGLSE